MSNHSAFYRESTLPPDPDILVMRSRLDPDVWVCVPSKFVGATTADLLCPGRLRAVKRFAEDRFGDGEPVRWERRDPDTWEMVFVD